jgi:hypothetical protein
MKYLWHGNELGLLLVLLADVGQPAEDEHAHDDHQHEQAQLFVAELYTTHCTCCTIVIM